MKLVNWNVERPSLTCQKNELRIARLLAMKPDVVVLTETSKAVDLGADYVGMFTEPSPRKPRDGEAVAAIWVRKEGFAIAKMHPTSDPREAICLEFDARNESFLLYASIIPYHAWTGPNGDSKQWQEHKKAIAWQGEDWRRLREQHPDHHIIVAGDLNQARGIATGYGTAEVRNLLSTALTRADLHCVTEVDFRATHGLSRSNIDHVCLSSSLLPRLESVDAWEGAVGGVELSDHNGITVMVRDN